ncbi:MAG: pilus assembly PilX N-terminal domain-containing protein [Proteobacteria bacterium]|nr:pilus assembly PilX N-terminal domain-containing protein [Pseudomonadota bacterium]
MKHRRQPASRAQQRGVALFIALIIMVAMSLAGVALIRATDATTSVVGNIAFRQSSLLAANWAIEQATSAVYSDESRTGSALITDTKADDAANNYYATYQDYAATPAPESTTTSNPNIPQGIPAVLQKKSAYPFVPYVDASKNEVRYVIERMCRLPGTADATYCDMMPPKKGSGTTITNTSVSLGTAPLFRVTVRVDGPSNTGTSFVQAWLH